jgi:hypothetical protein
MTTDVRIEGVSFYWERRVLEEKLEAIRQHCQDALEDAVLMGCDEQQIRSVLQELVARVENPYAGARGRIIRAALSS